MLGCGPRGLTAATCSPFFLWHTAHMSFWPFVRDDQAGARVARPSDRVALTSLLARTWRRHGIAALEDQAELLSNGISTVLPSHGEAQGFLGLFRRAPAGHPPQVWVDVNLAAVEPSGRADGVLTSLVGAAVPALRREGATGIVCLAPPGWLQEGLARAGFAEEDQVITYAFTDYLRPLPADQPATLRGATGGDADAVLQINALAFGPFWQYDDPVVMSWMLTADRGVVAEVNEEVVGFAITTYGLAGGYGHLIRIATHPRFRGRGIGRQLVVDAVNFARRAGAPGLALNTQASNRVSRSLYESLGFRLTGHSLAVMVCRL